MVGHSIFFIIMNYEWIVVMKLIELYKPSITIILIPYISLFYNENGVQTEPLSPKGTLRGPRTEGLKLDG